MPRRLGHLSAVIAVACSAALALASLAAAKDQRHPARGHDRPRSAHGRPGDRNGDRIPDRWERAHHLSTRVDQSRLDPDGDGLANLGEYLAGDDPRDPDTDGDGVDDSAEGAGRVVRLAGGRLTVALFTGRTVTAAFGDDSDLACDATDSTDEAGAGADAERGRPRQAGDPAGDPAADDPAAEDPAADGDPAAGDDAEDGPPCDETVLVPGVQVTASEAVGSAGARRWSWLDVDA